MCLRPFGPDLDVSGHFSWDRGSEVHHSHGRVYRLAHEGRDHLWRGKPRGDPTGAFHGPTPRAGGFLRGKTHEHQWLDGVPPWKPPIGAASAELSSTGDSGEPDPHWDTTSCRWLFSTTVSRNSTDVDSVVSDRSQKNMQNQCHPSEHIQESVSSINQWVGSRKKTQETRKPEFSPNHSRHQGFPDLSSRLRRCSLPRSQCRRCPREKSWSRRGSWMSIKVYRLPAVHDVIDGWGFPSSWGYPKMLGFWRDNPTKMI